MRGKKKRERLLSTDTLDEFCQDAGNYLRRGHTLNECFAAMAARATGAGEERLYLELRTGVRTGSLAAAMRKTGAFPEYMVDLIDHGEQENCLEETFTSLSSYFERERTANQSLRGRAAYPAVMAALATAILIIAAGFVLPLFADQFSALGLSFSPFARWAMRAGRWLAGVAGVLLTGAVFAGVLLWLILQNRSMHFFYSTLLARKLAAAQFTAALALFCRCGKEDRDTVRLAAFLTKHPEIDQAAAQMQNDLAEGASLPQALAQSGLVSGVALSRLRSAGRPAFILDEAAARLAIDTATRMDRLLVRLEPIIVLALSASAGAILLSVMLPLLGGLAAMA